tara:strand:- start:1005 stop:1583 length:579 start_codon:yes stop_codon:yes gene_type:complete
MSDLELKTDIYFIDNDGNYHKCHKLFPYIRKVFGEVETLNGEILEITRPKEHFEKSLNIGKGVEQRVCDKINIKYPKAHVIQGYCKGYDIYVPEIDMKIEVKQDKKSNYTGNFVIETEFNGKLSGLSTTEADYWVLYDGGCFIWIKPIKLRELILDLRQVTFVGKGDDKPKKAYLVKKESIMALSDKIDTNI